MTMLSFARLSPEASDTRLYQPAEVVCGAGEVHDGEVHVWWAETGASHVRPSITEQCPGELLSEDEWQRVRRYRLPADQSRFITRRGLLRRLLSRYTGTSPDCLRFRYNRHGKPELDGVNEGLHFNVSHSGGLTLFAVSRSPVGIDVQRVEAKMNYERFAARFFSAREQAALRAVPLHCRRQAFFSGWARKEAYVKARGCGLSYPLARFSVSLAPGQPARLLHDDADPEEGGRWSLREMSGAISADHVAALAVHHDVGCRAACSGLAFPSVDTL